MPDTQMPAGFKSETISCVVCAYNEALQIQQILKAIQDHPLLSEIIVVNDGSTDDTAALAGQFPGVKLISYGVNRGKTYALSQGIAAATGDYLMLLDADLDGLTAADVTALAEPVLHGRTRVSLSLRANSLALYHALGIDFVTGERMLPAALIKPHVQAMEALPRWGGEVFMNRLITGAKLSIAVVKWRTVFNIRKARKIGAWRGLLAELSMTADVFRVLTPVEVVRQHLSLMARIKRPPVTRYFKPQYAAQRLRDYREKLFGGGPVA